MEKGECSICNHKFDGEQHRPRALPCGHGFCTGCINACIARDNKSCPVCRMNHGASSAKQLPVNFPLEELLEKATISELQQHESDQESDVESVDMCPKHKGVPLYFYCKSHNRKVCHSCAVIDHPPSSCTLISLDDHIKEKKEVEIVAVQKRKQNIMDIQQDLKKIHEDTIDDITNQKSKKQNLEQEVKLLLDKIEEVNQEIVKKHTSEEIIIAEMQRCQENHQEFELIENKLRTVKGNRKITKECQIAAKEIAEYEMWEEKLRNDFNVKTGKFAQVKRNGILRSSRVLSEGGRTLVPSLSVKVIPPFSAELLLEAELGLTSSTMTVFMDLSVQGSSLGQVQIKVLTDRPHGKQFVMLALGTDGPTFRGANFEERGSSWIELTKYVTENKSKSKANLLTLKKEHNTKITKGKLHTLTVDSFSFNIATEDLDVDWPGYFGDIISGLGVIDRAFTEEFDITDIVINECGIVL